MRLWRFGILPALVHRVLKDGNFDIPAKKKTDKTRLYSETPGNEGCFERNGKTDKSKYLF